MIITKQISIDLVRRECAKFIDAVQCDANTRAVAVTLTADGAAWKPPAGVKVSVAFKKPDGKKGWYDKLPDGSSACSVSGNVVTAVLVPEALTVAGKVDAVIVFQDGKLDQLATFGFTVLVEPNPAAGSVISNDYYDISHVDVGRLTAEGGEIFNDYDTNQALAPYAKAEGTGSRAGCYGYKTLSTDQAAGTITVDDAKLTGNKAINHYAVGDILCFDGQFHWYHELKISALSADSAGNTVITVATVDGRDMVDLTRDGSGDEFEDWVYVPSKPTAGIAGTFSCAAYAGGEGSVAIGRGAKATGRNAQAIGNYATAIGRDSVAGYNGFAEGRGTAATGFHSHAEGNGSKATGSTSHAEGYKSKAAGDYAHVEGNTTIANGENSHAEGYKSIAEGPSSHAEGRSSTTASANYSHAEGYKSTAEGAGSHAEGTNSKASGMSAHAEGEGTIAAGKNQHVQGKYNVKDTAEKYAHIVGGGTGDANRKNIHTVDWQGNAFYSGSVEADAVILRSTTAGSSKKFRLTVDDSGTLTVTEV